MGIHDLVKRDAFGGDIYLSNGSHGCVNTPIDAVQMIYDNIEINTPIVVY
ncbi:MAG: L,D-transpeptidase [Blautia marasmi]